MKPRLVVIGNGMAAHRALERLQTYAPDHYAVTVFGAEPHAAYNRILLSPVLSGEKAAGAIRLAAQPGIMVHLDDPVTRIDRVRREVHSRSGRVVGYERLLLATGSQPVRLPLPGANLTGVMGFRDLDDIDAMLACAAGAGRAVVIGGGLLGIEAADGLRQRGMAVTLLHRGDALLNQQLDAGGAAVLLKRLRARGIDVQLNADTSALQGEARVQAVVLADGRRLPADLVVMAVGIRPEISLARAAGLQCGRGVRVDDTMQTFDPRIYAIGECAEHRSQTIGLVAPAWQQAEVCAAHLAEWGHRRYRLTPVATRLKVSGIDVFSAGSVTPTPGDEALVYRDPPLGHYRRLLIRDRRIVSVVMIGDIAAGPWYFEQLQAGADISAIRDSLLFGQPYCQAA